MESGVGYFLMFCCLVESGVGDVLMFCCLVESGVGDVLMFCCLVESGVGDVLMFCCLVESGVGDVLRPTANTLAVYSLSSVMEKSVSILLYHAPFRAVQEYKEGTNLVDSEFSEDRHCTPKSSTEDLHVSVRTAMIGYEGAVD